MRAHTTHTTYYNESALTSAAMKGHLSAMKLLDEEGAGLSHRADRDTALGTALEQGHQDTTAYLLSIGDRRPAQKTCRHAMMSTIPSAQLLRRRHHRIRIQARPRGSFCVPLLVLHVPIFCALPCSQLPAVLRAILLRCALVFETKARSFIHITQARVTEERHLEEE
jgi:hypothetical protein